MNPKITALLNQIESGKLHNDKARILNQVILSRGVTSYSLERRLEHIKPTTILARLSDLEDLGLIYKQSTRKIIGNEQPYSLFVYEPDENKQKQNALKRKNLKFEAWKKRGLEEFSELIHKGLRDELTQLTIF